MSYYSISFIKKWEKEKIEIQRLIENDINNFLRQVKYGIATVWGYVIEWIYGLDYFQIKERNFVYKEWNQYYVEFDYDTWSDFHDWYIELSQYSNLISVPEDEILDKTEKDVTNELLYKFKIIWKNFYKKWKVLFDNNILSVDWTDFIIKQSTKISELLDMLFRAKSFYNKGYFTYQELKDFYKLWGVKYNQIELYDLNEFNIKDIVRKKLNSIKNRTQMTDRILKISPNEISIRQETAI